MLIYWQYSHITRGVRLTLSVQYSCWLHVGHTIIYTSCWWLKIGILACVNKCHVTWELTKGKSICCQFGFYGTRNEMDTTRSILSDLCPFVCLFHITCCFQSFFVVALRVCRKFFRSPHLCFTVRRCINLTFRTVVRLAGLFFSSTHSFYYIAFLCGTCGSRQEREWTDSRFVALISVAMRTPWQTTSLNQTLWLRNDKRLLFGVFCIFIRLRWTVCARQRVKLLSFLVFKIISCWIAWNNLIFATSLRSHQPAEFFSDQR